MFRRTLLLTLTLAVLAGATAGVSASSPKGGLTSDGSVGPIPPYLTTSLPLVCQVHTEGRVLVADCHATSPNPTPPKDTKVFKLPCNGTGMGKVTLWPDGEVTAECRLKA